MMNDERLRPSGKTWVANSAIDHVASEVAFNVRALRCDILAIRGVLGGLVLVRMGLVVVPVATHPGKHQLAWSAEFNDPDGIRARGDALTVRRGQLIGEYGSPSGVLARGERDRRL